MPRTLTIDLSKIIEDLQAEQRKHRDAGDTIVAKATTENRDFTKDEEAALAEHQGKVVSIRKRVEILTKQAESDDEAERPGESRSRGKPGKERGAADRSRRAGGAEEEPSEDEREYRDVHSKWLRRGFNGLNTGEQELLNGRAETLPETAETRALSALTGGLGGFTCPAEFAGVIDEARKDYSGVLSAGPTVITTSTGNDLGYPTVNDTSNEGEQVEENATQTDSNVAFGNVTFKAYMFSSKLVLLPLNLIQDSAVDIESMLGRLLGERLGRIQNRRLTTGNNANQPQGIVSGSTLGKQVASGTAITFEELIDLQHSVDPAYRASARWMFADSTFAALRKLKDSDGRPIWQPAATSGLTEGAPGVLLGSPYTINNHMAAMASGAKSVLWGDFRKYHVRRVKGVTLIRLAERYAEKGQVGFFAFMRVDGRMVDAGMNPIKHILHP